jgi:hypothetical protein
MAVDRSTTTVTVNAAFLQEIKEVNAELWSLLEEVRKACSDVQNLRENGRRAVDLLENLRDQLALHFSLEEAFGYFDDPVIVAPQLSVMASALRDEHRALYAQIRDFTDDVDERYRSGKLPSTAPAVVARFQEYYDHLQQHENRENELIQQAYGDDIGVGD